MNYLNETIDALNKKLASGEISADQLAADTVKNIKDTDKKLNAWITVDEDAKPAENLDFSKSKLAGIPIAIKDKISSFKKILQRILMIEIGLIAISMLIASHSFMLAILFIVIGIGLIILLQQMLKQRLVKMA